MKTAERINLFKKFDDDFFTYLFELKVDKLSVEDYNKKLQKSEDDIKNDKSKIKKNLN